MAEHDRLAVLGQRLDPIDVLGAVGAEVGKPAVFGVRVLFVLAAVEHDEAVVARLDLEIEFVQAECVRKIGRIRAARLVVASRVHYRHRAAAEVAAEVDQIAHQLVLGA